MATAVSVDLKTALQLLCIDIKNRWKKIPFYFRHVCDRLMPRRFGAPNFHTGNGYDEEFVADRVNYYHKTNARFSVLNKIPAATELSRGHSAYVVDMLRALNGFDVGMKLDYRFGDSTAPPQHPTITKSRKISGENQNAVLLKLNSIRHFHFVRDPLPFGKKKNMAVWRGKCKHPARRLLVDQYREHPLCNVDGVDRAGAGRYLRKSYMQLSEQLTYKFIISIEGNDVATNIKWIMSSNSLCFMPKPTCETWFMEGRLIAGFHYVPVSDDYHDLEEKIEYYSSHTEDALAILKNAQQYVAQFRDHAREAYIIHRVLEKYFQCSGQLP